MYPASELFFRTLAGSHTVASRAELLVDGDVALDLTDADLVVDGNVQVQNAPISRSGSLTLIDRTGDLSPIQGDELLAPVGNEVRLYRGVNFEDGSGAEMVPIGTFRFTATDADYPRIDLTLLDRAWTIAGAHLEAGLTIAKGTNYVTAILDLVRTAFGPGLETNFPSTSETTASMFFEADSDPWDLALQLAANLGQRLYFDQWGVCVMSPVPDPRATPPVWVFDNADLGNLALPNPKLAWDATDAVNAVVVIGENSDNAATYRGVAYDDDPTSPTQYGGRFGRRPKLIRDEKVTSTAQAVQRARAELLREIGLVKTVTVPALVNPCLEAGDLIRVITADRGLDDVFVLDKFPIPLRASGTQQLERTRKVPVISA
jgi:Domain of unknown function (DUF5047)